jgi:hypothetical protein
VAIVAANAAEEAKASRANPTPTPLTSPSDDEKQQNKRLAIYGKLIDCERGAFVRCHLMD